MQKSNSRSSSAIILALFIISLCLPFLSVGLTGAESIGNLRQRSARLESQIKQNEAQAEHLEGVAGNLKDAIGALDSKIASATAHINETTTKIAKLDKELKQTQKELARQKELLKSNMVALYKRGDASTVELIVGSDSFSEFIDEQEYLERVKGAIQDSAAKVVELEKKIKAQREQQKELLEQQKSARRSLNETRGERASLLARTQGQEARYRSVVAALERKQAQVDRELAAMVTSGRYVSQGYANAGDVIGRVGMTGFTFGPHLHFEIRNSSFRPIPPSSQNYTWPVPASRSISQGYGCVPQGWYYTPCAGGTMHTGIDISAGIGSSIVAAKSGTIIQRSDNGDGYGRKIILKHGDGTYTLYAHTSY